MITLCVGSGSVLWDGDALVTQAVGRGADSNVPPG